MENDQKTVLTATTEVNAPIAVVWNCWNNPADIMQWNNADENWQNLNVINDIREGGKFSYAMAKKDGSEQFDFEGTYNKVVTQQLINYTLSDGRTSEIAFSGSNPVVITEAFEPVPTLPLQMQHDFCSTVLRTFKNYVEKMVS